MQDFDFAIFIFGCIGAAAPEIVRLYRLRYGLIEFPRSYFIISVIFFLLGGFIASILPAVTYWGAFYAGVSCPVIISTSLGKAPRFEPRLELGAPARTSLGWKEYLGILYSR